MSWYGMHPKAHMKGRPLGVCKLCRYWWNVFLKPRGKHGHHTKTKTYEQCTRCGLRATDYDKTGLPVDA